MSDRWKLRVFLRALDWALGVNSDRINMSPWASPKRRQNRACVLHLLERPWSAWCINRGLNASTCGRLIRWPSLRLAKKVDTFAASFANRYLFPPKLSCFITSLFLCFYGKNDLAEWDFPKSIQSKILPWPLITRKNLKIACNLTKTRGFSQIDVTSLP